MLIRPNNKKGITIQAQKVLVRLHAFLRPLIVNKVKYQPSQKTVYLPIIKDIVRTVFFTYQLKNHLV